MVSSINLSKYARFGTYKTGMLNWILTTDLVDDTLGLRTLDE